MPRWTAVAAGVVAFPAFVAVTLVAAPPAAFLGGFVSGAVAAFLGGPGLRSGAVHGTLTGVAVTALGWAGLWAFVTAFPPERVAPGFGLSVVFLAAAFVAVGVQCLVAGTAYGLFTRVLG